MTGFLFLQLFSFINTLTSNLEKLAASAFALLKIDSYFHEIGGSY